MSIQQKDDGWIGTSIEDIRPYLRALTAAGYAVERTVEAVCDCGNCRFAALIDGDQQLAQLTCVACASNVFIGDSEEFWDEADPEALGCRCGSRVFEVSVGHSSRIGVANAWVTVGVRCVDCGLLCAPIDWADDRAD